MKIKGFVKKEIVIGIFQLIGNFVQWLNRGKVSLAGCLGSQVRSILGQPFQLPQHPPLTTTWQGDWKVVHHFGFHLGKWLGTFGAWNEGIPS